MRLPMACSPSSCRGKFGQAVAAELAATTAGGLAAFTRAELVQRFGEQQGAFLAALALAQVLLGLLRSAERGTGGGDLCV